MYTREALLDIHERTHRCLAKLIAHCATLPDGAADRRVEGYGDGTVRERLHHVIAAEEYWLGVIEGRAFEDSDASATPTLASVEAFRARTAAATREWIERASAAAIDDPRTMRTWDGAEHVLVPGRVVMRTQTHVFHHAGQVAAMCRALGSPAPSIDFPIA